MQSPVHNCCTVCRQRTRSNTKSLSFGVGSDTVGCRGLGAVLQVDSLRQVQERCTLRIITVNDVYELGNLPYLDGVIRLVQQHGLIGIMGVMASLTRVG